YLRMLVSVTAPEGRTGPKSSRSLIARCQPIFGGSRQAHGLRASRSVIGRRRLRGELQNGAGARVARRQAKGLLRMAAAPLEGVEVQKDAREVAMCLAVPRGDFDGPWKRRRRLFAPARSKQCNAQVLPCDGFVRLQLQELAIFSGRLFEIPEREQRVGQLP